MFYKNARIAKILNEIRMCKVTMEFEDTETMSIEEARAMTHEAIRKEYARV